VTTIIEDLKILEQQTPTTTNSENAIHLLKMLPAIISEEERAQILVPDRTDQLRPLNTVCYNDIGTKAAHITEDNIYITHPLLHEDLARQLSLNYLGLKFALVGRQSRDMGEDPKTTIRNRLTEYTEQQFFTEFIANASDAGATRFGILIDEYQESGKDLLSSNMQKFQACPSLVIYNDALFSDKDFDGICNIGIGGKAGRTDSIGQFGSGALTMFHFTEVCPLLFVCSENC
jgi:hypothetical protein